MGVMGDMSTMGSDLRVLGLGVAAPCKGRVIGLSIDCFRSSSLLPAPLVLSSVCCWVPSSPLSVWSRLLRRLRQAT